MSKKDQAKQPRRNLVLKIALIFIVSYGAFLAAWIGVKGYYGIAMTKAASKSIASINNLDLIQLKKNEDVIKVAFVAKKFGVQDNIKIALDISTSNYTFNVPLTLAIMAAFFPLVNRKRVYIEALVLLVIVHFLYIFTMEGQQINSALTELGYAKKNKFTQILWEFSWGFVDNMVVRFEPFLVGAYIYFFSKKTTKSDC